MIIDRDYYVRPIVRTELKRLKTRKIENLICKSTLNKQKENVTYKLVKFEVFFVNAIKLRLPVRKTHCIFKSVKTFF